MRNTQMLISPFYILQAVFAQVCLPAPWQAGLPVRKSCFEPTLRRSDHGKSIGVQLNFHLYADLSLTKHRTVRGPGDFKSP